MCSVLMSIKPEYVYRILSGEKEYEFRKTACKKKVDRIVIYSTLPDQKVVGEAEVEKVIIDSPSRLWKKTKSSAGIEKELYDEYYKNRNRAVAYKLINIVKYREPMSLADIGIKSAPQSYQYIR